MRARTWGAVVAVLALISWRGAGSRSDAACNSGGSVPPPESKIIYERVDTSRFPEIDAYFRMIDTDPAKPYVEPTPQSVRVTDGPAGGAVQQGTVKDTNFANPILRPLAMMLCLDRSNSVKSVLPEINNAVKSSINLMVGAAQNTPQQGDETSLVALCGSGGASIKILPFTTDQATADAFRNQYFTDTCGGSPIFAAWDDGISMINGHPFLEPDAARAMVTITDGKNNKAPNSPERLVANAASSGIQMYSIGPVRISGNRSVAVGSVCRDVLMDVARKTGGAYFEPVPPAGMKTLPPVPEPDDPTTQMDDPAALPDDVAGNYLKTALGQARQFAGSANPPLTGDLPGPLKTAAETFTTLNVTPTTWENYNAAIDAAGPNIPLQNLGILTYSQLEQVNGALAALADQTQQPISQADITNYYDTQISSMLKKINVSLKRVYRVTYTVPGDTPPGTEPPPFDGSERGGGGTITIGGGGGFNGSGTFTYFAPIVIDENAQVVRQFPVRPTDTRLRAVVNTTNPRGGPWAGNLEQRLTVELYSQAAPAGQPRGRSVKLAQLLPGNQIKFPTRAENGPDQPLTADEQAEATRYLQALTVQFDADPAQLSYTLQGALPGCVGDPDNPVARPLPNDSFPDKTRTLWYSVTPVLERSYTYTGRLPSGGRGPITAKASTQLSPLVVYVRDKTPPNFAVYLTTEGKGTSILESRELIPESSPPGRKHYLTGKSWGTADELDRKALTKPDDAQPLDLEGGASSLGFVVPQGTQVRVQVVARDNADRNFAPDWPVVDREFTTANLNEDAFKDAKPPYLPRLNPDQIGQRTASGKTFNSGVSWAFEEAGSLLDAGQETRSFPNANVAVENDTLTPIAGQETFIVVAASDASGNIQRFKIPVRVTPVGIEIEKLFQERQRK